MVEPSTQQLKQVGYPVLTGTRAVAAYLVYFHHIGFIIPGFLGVVLASFRREAHIGVTIFYVLSGFVIAANYKNDVRLGSGWLKRYYWNRFCRIIPVYWFLLIVYYLIFDPNHDPIFWLLNLSLLKCFAPSTIFLGIGQSWSLGVELSFYAISPFIFVMLRRISPAKLLVGTFIYEIVIFAIWKCADAYHFGTSVPWVFLYFYTFAGRVFEFIVGIYLASIVLREPKQEDSERHLPYQTLSGLIGIILVVYVMHFWQSGESAASIFLPEGSFLNNVILPLPVALFFYGLIHEKSMLAKFFLTRPLQFLGKASYSFYLVHVGALSTYILSHHGSSHYLVNLIMIQALAALIYVVIEHPLHFVLKRMFDGNRVGPLRSRPVAS